MVQLTDIIRAFLRGIARSKLSLLGAAIATLSFPLLTGAIALDLLGLIDNPYILFFIYMVLGPGFVSGLVLVIVGLFFFKGKDEMQIFTMEYLREQFSDPIRYERVRRLVLLGAVLTTVSAGVIAVMAYSGYHYMESVGFCGRFCHKVMSPEYTAYKKSPHSSVPCVECHIGSGAQWFVKSKISGSRQLFAVLFDTYPRPIETPVHGLRPARDTCEECHRPEVFHGDKLVIRDKTLDDATNTPVQSVILMKIGSAGDRVLSSHGIHWHVAPENKITYTPTDWTREKISEVVLHRPDGSKKIYRSEHKAEGKKGDHGTDPREMDCIDCHNRPSHVYLSLEDAINRKFSEGDIPRELPFAKQQVAIVLQKEYPTTEAAKSSIAADLSAWYQKNYPEIVKSKPELLTRAIAGAQAAFAENVFPEMKIKWGTYRSNLEHGEEFERGCFRCHDGNLKTDKGESISSDCNTCHTILAEGEKDPAILKTLRGE